MRAYQIYNIASFILHETNSVSKEVEIYYGKKLECLRKIGSSQNFSLLDRVTRVGLIKR